MNPQTHTAMDSKASMALMKFLSDLARRLGVAKHVYVVGGAVRNWVMKVPIKDIDVVIDSVALRGKGSEWFAREVAKAISVETNIATNKYGVALLHIVGEWMLGDSNLQGEDIEIANAREESYGQGGYTPDKVSPTNIETDIYRREFTVNTLLWSLYDLASGPDKAEIIDLTGCGLRDLEERTLRCPMDPDKTFSDDPSRMVRAVKFLVKYGLGISSEVAGSIRKNRAKLHNIPPSHLSNMLINTFLREPTGKKALVEMHKLGLLDVIKEIAQRDDAFRDALGNWADREAKVQFIFDLMDIGFPSGKRLNFLSPPQLAQVRKVTVNLSHDAADQYVGVLQQPGKSLDTRALMAEFPHLRGPEMRKVQDIARRHLLADPALAVNGRLLTLKVREDLATNKTARRLSAASISKTGCIIAAGEFGGSRALFKNRDRNYTPEIRVHHEIRSGTEILYMRDELTGWIEGINEFGIGIVNSALMVGRDEAEKKIVKLVGKKSKDGLRILTALEKTTLSDAVDSIAGHMGGVKGHTFVSNAHKGFVIEMTSRHNPVVTEMASDQVYVRTNHGYQYPDAGYTRGSDFVSSIARRERAVEELQKVDGTDGIAPAIYGHRLKDWSDQNNMVRDTGGMRTVSQMVLDLRRKRMHMYLLPGRVRYLGYTDNLPSDYKPKLKLELYKYTDLDSDGEFDVIKRRPKKPVAPGDVKGSKKAASMTRIVDRVMRSTVRNSSKTQQVAGLVAQVQKSSNRVDKVNTRYGMLYVVYSTTGATYYTPHWLEIGLLLDWSKGGLSQIEGQWGDLKYPDSIGLTYPAEIGMEEAGKKFVQAFERWWPTLAKPVEKIVDIDGNILNRRWQNLLQVSRALRVSPYAAYAYALKHGHEIQGDSKSIQIRAGKG